MNVSKKKFFLWNKKGTSIRPRLVVYCSNKYLYIQIINDKISKTLISYSTLNQSLKFKKITNITCNSCYLTGISLARLCIKRGIFKVIFDRNSQLYHGHIEALAIGARIGGLKF